MSFLRQHAGCERIWLHFIVSDAPFCEVISAIRNHFTQSSCWQLTNDHRYCYILAFLRFVWPSPCGWTAVDILQAIPKRLHNYQQNVEANWGPQSEQSLLEVPWVIPSRSTTTLPTQEQLLSCSGEWIVAFLKVFPRPPRSHQTICIPVNLLQNPSRYLYEAFTGSSKRGIIRNVKCHQLRNPWQLWKFHT